MIRIHASMSCGSLAVICNDDQVTKAVRVVSTVDSTGSTRGMARRLQATTSEAGVAHQASGPHISSEIPESCSACRLRDTDRSSVTALVNHRLEWRHVQLADIHSVNRKHLIGMPWRTSCGNLIPPCHGEARSPHTPCFRWRS